MSLTIAEQPVKISPHGLAGDLVIPESATGVVLFAHGNGSSRLNPGNRYVAGILQQAGLATLLLDLLTDAEEEIDQVTGELRFDIELLSERLLEATDWLRRTRSTRDLSIGCFGASTGAAAALVTAAERPFLIGAVVSRGGRPDLAASALPRVQAPTLLIVGSNDRPVIALNQQARAELRCEKQLAIVAGATHLFEEPGTLDEVSKLARNWFRQHLNSKVGSAITSKPGSRINSTRSCTLTKPRQLSPFRTPRRNRPQKFQKHTQLESKNAGCK